MNKGGLDAIKGLDWFEGFDWDGLINGTLKPPVMPRVMNKHDLSNFDDPEDGEIHREVEKYYPELDEDRSWEDEF